MKKRSEERCFKPIWGPFGYRMLIGNSYAERPGLLAIMLTSLYQRHTTPRI